MLSSEWEPKTQNLELGKTVDSELNLLEPRPGDSNAAYIKDGPVPDEIALVCNRSPEGFHESTGGPSHSQDDAAASLCVHRHAGKIHGFIFVLP